LKQAKDDKGFDKASSVVEFHL